MAIQWDRSLSVGVKLIDEQHQELFGRVNRLLEAMMKGEAKAEIDKVVQYLGGYVTEHFEAEEELMARHRYADAAAHRQAHADFVKALASLRAELDAKGARSATSIALNRLACGWLREHICTTDRAFGKFLQAIAPGERRA